ncbi:MMPL family transporter [Paenibacillus nanensis]|uniref:MMPL family transporter n=1 Tax=Paenibacillus nanensis TaxID=393251 RepID=A0A3A1V4I4_9BACL|nr:MMPL family transporter [Paenibacillus nanensis]RIX52440.1 MMPL family transporter [Paenibacillus nanensis]
MAKLLYRTGERIYLHKFKTLAASLIALVIAAALVLGLGASFTGDMSIPGTKSELAMKVLNEEFPSLENSNNGNIQMVFKAPEGETLESETVRQSLQQLLAKLSSDADVASIAGPYDNQSLSANKEIGYATITYKLDAGEVAETSLEKVEAAAEEARALGIQAEFSGNIGSPIPEIGGLSEVVGIVVAFLILAYTFRSFLVAGLPILTAVIGLGIGILLVLIGTNIMEMSSVSITLAVMLGLAVGIDYALFIISRHRQSLAEGKSVQQSIAIANATAGSSVLFAGLTVIIALLGLAVVRIPFLTTMGIAAAITVAAAIAIAIVLVPAMLAIVGEKARPKSKKAGSRGEKSKSTNRWGKTVVKYPLPIAVAAIMLLVLISLPALKLETGLPDNGLKSEETTERRAYDLLAEAYGPGYHAPLVVVVKAEPAAGGAATGDRIGDAVKGLGAIDNIATITEPILNQSGDTAIVNVIPGTGPHNSKTKDLVQNIREYAGTIAEAGSVELMVTGMTAVNIDISDKLNEALPQFALLIVGLAFILLGIVFRSIWIPIKAVLGYLLTLTATLGFIVFVVQEGHLASFFGIPEAGPVLSFLPVLTAGILFGLAMDYEVFLVSRMKEEYSRTGDGRKAVLAGMANSGSVVSAAGLIMVVVFASFIFVEDTMIKSMGLALAFGIFVDAFIVRMMIVPAIMTLMPRAAWYFPRWLNRITPKIDVEGESIHKVQQAAEAPK